MRELENDQHVSPEANVSRFPFIFFNLSGFSTLLVTTCLLRGLFIKDLYHGTTIYNTKTISSTVLELHTTQRQIESPGRQNAAQWTVWNKTLCYFSTTRKQCVSIFSKDDRNFFFLTNDYEAGSQILTSESICFVV